MPPPELQLFEQRFQEAMVNLKQMAEAVNDEYRYDIRGRSAVMEPSPNAPV